MLAKPLNVALTTLIGFVEPYDLANTSFTPANSKTALIAPPAIIPVPGDAGCIYTVADPCLALTA